MFMLVQTVAACAAVALTFLIFQDNPPPAAIYVGVAIAAGWLSTKLLALWKYGRGNKVTLHRPD